MSFQKLNNQSADPPCALITAVSDRRVLHIAQQLDATPYSPTALLPLQSLKPPVSAMSAVEILTPLRSKAPEPHIDLPSKPPSGAC